MIQYSRFRGKTGLKGSSRLSCIKPGDGRAEDLSLMSQIDHCISQGGNPQTGDPAENCRRPLLYDSAGRYQRLPENIRILLGPSRTGGFIGRILYFLLFPYGFRQEKI